MITWFVKPYEALSKDELYMIIQLRVRIFILEQESIYDELDGLDQIATHLGEYTLMARH